MIQLFYNYPHVNCLQHLTLGLPKAPRGHEHTALPLTFRQIAPAPHTPLLRQGPFSLN